jgi:hypothetical protein
MVYLLATLVNDAEYLPSLLAALAAEVGLRRPPAPLETWGVGYFADGRALIIRKPVEVLRARSAFELAPAVKSKVLLACAQVSPVREQTPPFRFRRWLFAVGGDLEALGRLRGKVAERLPDFVRTEFGGASPGELAFGMFLADLHRASRLDDPLMDAPAVGETLARTAETIARLSGEVEGGPVRATYVASNGRALAVAASGQAASWKVQEGLEALPGGPPDPAMNDFKQVAEGLRRFRAVIVASGAPTGGPGWRELRAGEGFAVDARLGLSRFDVG